MIYSNTDPLPCHSYQIFCPYIQDNNIAGFVVIYCVSAAKKSNLSISLLCEERSLLYIQRRPPLVINEPFSLLMLMSLLPMHRWGQASAWHHLHHHSLLTHLSTPLQSAPFVTLFSNLFHFHLSCWIMTFLLLCVCVSCLCVLYWSGYL